MHHPIRGSRACALLILAIATVALGACGSSSGSSGDASSLLKQTFTGSHTVTSGNLSFSLTVNPSGSSTLTSPIGLSFGGPFHSLGAGKLPRSNFSIRLSAQGQSGTLGILSTGTAGYVTLQGTAYQLPAATFQRLESSFAQVAANPGSGSSGSGQLSKLGIHPLDWLEHPSVVGTESVAGTDTTHIRATVNISALLGDLNTFLGKASSLGVSGAGKIPTSISAATRSRIAGEVQSPTFDVWTGKADKTVRKLAISLKLPVTGQISTALGGLSSAQIGLTMQYADLNQPQTITSPTNVRPYAEFATKLKTFLTALQSTVASAGPGGAGTGGSATTTTARATTTAPASTPTAPSAATPSATTSSATTSSAATPSASPAASDKIKRYSDCLAKAKGDITKMQPCAALINGQ